MTCPTCGRAPVIGGRVPVEPPAMIDPDRPDVHIVVSGTEHPVHEHAAAVSVQRGELIVQVAPAGRDELVIAVTGEILSEVGTREGFVRLVVGPNRV